MSARYVIYREGEQFRFVLRDESDEVVLLSERYTTKQSAQKGVDSVRMNCPEDEHYERKYTQNGSWMFFLKATNGECIGTSPMYATSDLLDHGVLSVRANGPIASIDDEA